MRSLETAGNRLQLNDDGTPIRKYEESEESDSRVIVRTTLGLVFVNAFVLIKNVLFSSEPAHAAGQGQASAQPPQKQAAEDDVAEVAEAEQGDGTDERFEEDDQGPGKIGSGTTFGTVSSQPIVIEPELGEIRYNRGSGRFASSNDNETLYGAPAGRGIDVFGDSFGRFGPGGGHGGSGGQGGSPGGHDPDGPGDDDDDDDDETTNPNPTGPETRVNRAPSVLAPVVLGSLIADEARALTVADLLQGASDADGDALTVRSITASSGKIAVNPNGGWVFTPDAGDTSSVSFTYLISDGRDVIIQRASLDLVPRPPNAPIEGTSAHDQLIGTPQDDIIHGHAGDDQITGRDGNDIIYGGDGDDHILAGDGDDIVYAGRGNDVVYGGRGRDVLHGEDGDDFLNGEEDDDTLMGGVGRDTLLGGIGNDLLDGGDDSDALFGEAGNDVLLGGTGDDTLDAGDGDDVAIGGAGADTATMGAGNDTVIAEAGDGNDSYDGGADTDTYNTAGTSADATVDLSEGTASSSDIGTDTLTGFENVTTGAGDDTVTGNDDDNVVNAGAGDDIVELEGGNDTVVAQAGDGDDHYDGGSGSDTYDASSVTTDVTADLEEETVVSSATGSDTVDDFENVTTGAGNDTVTGNDDANCVDTGAGNDTVNLGAGIDVATLGDGDDTVVAEAGDGDDTYYGGSGRDTYDLSSTSADALIDLISERVTSVDVGTDIVIDFEKVKGGKGDDRIIANDAQNVIIGGPGDDRFEFHSSASIGYGRGYRDQILDFSPGDRIDIDKIRDEFADNLSDTFEDADIERFAIIAQGKDFSKPGELKLVHDMIDGHEVTILQGNTDWDAQAEFELELAGHYVLTDNDFYRA